MATFVFVYLLVICVPSAYAAAKVVTANGNAQISTAQSKFGGASGLFDGSGDYLSIADSADWAFGAGDFTIDFWVRRNSIGSRQMMLGQLDSGGADGSVSFIVEFQADNTVKAYFGYSGTFLTFASTGTIADTTTWHHIAYIRNGNNLYLYIDGIQGGTATTSATMTDSANSLSVGRAGDCNVFYFNGWIDECRISKGVARWTSNFAKPTAAYSLGSGDDDNVVLLMHMDGTDGSTTFTDDHQTGPPPPPPSDFSISASPTSQSVGAGSSASYTLTLTASSTYGGGTVSLSVTSGLPSGATGTITPNSVSLAASEIKTSTLSISTSITTPGGTSSIVVTATDGSKTHTVTVTLTVSAPGSYSFNVKAGATQIVVTLTYSWSGSGSPPLGSITIAGPGGTPTLSESGAVVYDRTSITVSGSTNTYSIIHRATFTITAPGSAQVWTAYASLAGVTSYNVAIEVS